MASFYSVTQLLCATADLRMAELLEGYATARGDGGAATVAVALGARRYWRLPVGGTEVEAEAAYLDGTATQPLSSLLIPL